MDSIAWLLIFAFQGVVLDILLIFSIIFSVVFFLYFWIAFRYEEQKRLQRERIQATVFAQANAIAQRLED